MMVVETWMVPILASFGEEEDDEGGGGSLSNLTMLRMLRLLRLARMVRLMRAVPELVTLLRGMAAAFRSVMSTLILSMIILYVFAICFKTVMELPLPHLFGSLPQSMWTLLFAGTLVDEPTKICQQINAVSQPILYMFLLYVLLSTYTVLNMLVGILCEVVSAVASAQKDKAAIHFVKATLAKILREIDINGDGLVSKNEFFMLMSNDEANHALTDLGVDVKNFLSLGDFLFDEEEGEDGEDGEEKALSFE
jgi:hypothetical protein